MSADRGGGGKRRARLEWALTVTLLLALALRVGVSFFAGLSWYSDDAYTYKREAASILAGGWVHLFPPGFPLFLAGLLRLAGGDGNRADALAIAANVAFSVAVVAMTYYLCRRWSPDRRLALAAAAVAACWPNQINYVRQILSEVPTAFLLCAATCLVAAGRGLAGGAALGLAIAFRTTLAPVAALLVLAALARRRWRDAAVLAAGVLIPVIVVAGTSASRGAGFALGGNTRVNFYVALNSYGDALDFDNGPENRFRDRPDGSVIEAASTYATAHLSEPRYFFGQRLAALWELWGPFPTGDSRGTAAKLLISLRTPLLLLGLVGMWVAGRRPGMEMAFFAVLSITAVHTAFFGTPRFTYVVEPLLIAAAVVGAHALWTRFARRDAGVPPATEVSDVNERSRDR